MAAGVTDRVWRIEERFVEEEGSEHEDAQAPLSRTHVRVDRVEHQ